MLSGQPLFNPATADLQSVTFPQWREVEPNERDLSPYLAICSIWMNVSQGDSLLAGTGWLAGPSTVITAAHVIRDGLSLAVDNSLTFVFPAGERLSVPSSACKIHELWDGRPAGPWDIAAVLLPDVATWWLPVESHRLDAGEALIAGFPKWPSIPTGTLVKATGTFFQPSQAGEQIVLHKIDTEKGHSGAPLVADLGNGGVAIALHVGGFRDHPWQDLHPRSNVALALNEPMITFIATHVNS